METVLGFRRGFFGLVAEGWDIEDTTGKGSRGPLPEEAGEVEFIVSLFFGERAGGTLWTADDFNSSLEIQVPGARRLTEEDIVRVRARRSELFRLWDAVPTGETMELVWK